jgi:cytochrome c oxidase subunit 7
MVLAPITGQLKRRIAVDISTSLVLGTAAAYAYWYSWHVPKMQRINGFYSELEAKKKAQNL